MLHIDDHHLFRLIPAWIGALLLCACHLTSIHDDPYVDHASFRNNPPRSIAVLPTIDVSDHPGIAHPMRKALYKAIAALPYHERELKGVDEFLAVLAARRSCMPEKLPAAAMADPRLADCVVYSQIERISRLYLIFYAHYRIDLSLMIADTRSRRILYRNRFVFYDRMGMPFYDPIGLATSSVVSLWHLRSEQLDTALADDAEEIASTLPVPDLLEMSTDGSLKLIKVEVATPRPVLSPGDQLTVKVEATAGCRISFSAGSRIRDIAMEEDSPGRYRGMYTVRKGDDTPFSIVELKINQSRGTESLVYAADEHPFSVDTQPPPRARVEKWWSGGLKAGLYLAFELHPGDSQKNKEIPAEYHVYRRKLGETKFSHVGISTEPIFRDHGATRGQTYDYFVVTRDAAGNSAERWSAIRLSFN